MVRSPTNIPSDPPLTGHGVEQANELANHLVTLDPPINYIYSSPLYRCLQTVKPTIEKSKALAKGSDKVRGEDGLG